MKTTITFVVPSRIEENIDKTLEHIFSCNYPQEAIEVYNVNGKKPSKQRNECIKISSGSIIYFVDNDSIVSADNIINALSIFDSDSSVGIVGGPAVHNIQNLVEEDIDICLSSFLCVGPINARYTQKKGEPIECSDKSIILCNMLVRREVFDKIGYFNENLYPNEENEFIDRVIESGYKIIYHSSVIVTRQPRKNISQYMKMLITYGAGRAKQMKELFLLKNMIFSMPMFFVLYVLSLPIMAMLILPKPYNMLYVAPCILYFIIAAMFSISVLPKRKSHKIRSLLVMSFMFFLTHCCYGIGFAKGLIKNIFRIKDKEVSSEININKVKSFS